LERPSIDVTEEDESDVLALLWNGLFVGIGFGVAEGKPATMSLGLLFAGVALRRAMSVASACSEGNLCMSRVQLREKGGIDWAIRGAGTGTGSWFDERASTARGGGCDIVAELDGAFGSYVTIGATGGTNGFAEYSHLSSAVRLFFGGIRVSPTPYRCLHR
jgi:hypothetical protein